MWLASVVASEQTACLAKERDAFRLLVARGNRAVQVINQRITRALCQRFTQREIAVLLDAAPVFELPGGTRLFTAGSAGGACCVMLRGALEPPRERRIGVLGPGRLCGLLGLIEGEAHSMSAAAHEQVTPMEIPAAVFARDFEGSAPGSAKFQRAIHRELLHSLSRTNNHLTRLIGQAHIHLHAARVTALHRDLA